MSETRGVGRPRVNPDTPMNVRQREAQLWYYAKHRDKRLLKMSLYKSRPDVRLKHRENYNRRLDKAARITGVPRRGPGKPRATVQERRAGLVARAESAGLFEVAAAIRAQLEHQVAA